MLAASALWTCFYLLCWARWSQGCLSFCTTSGKYLQADAHSLVGFTSWVLTFSEQPKPMLSVVQHLQVMFSSCQQWDGEWNCNHSLLAANTICWKCLWHFYKCTLNVLGHSVFNWAKWALEPCQLYESCRKLFNLSPLPHTSPTPPMLTPDLLGD